MVDCQSVEEIAELFTVESDGCLPSSDKSENEDLQICDGSVGSQAMLNVAEMVGDEGESNKGDAWDNKCE
jgi:hypothetical protein